MAREQIPEGVAGVACGKDVWQCVQEVDDVESRRQGAALGHTTHTRGRGDGSD